MVTPIDIKVLALFPLHHKIAALTSIRNVKYALRNGYASIPGNILSYALHVNQLIAKQRPVV